MLEEKEVTEEKIDDSVKEEEKETEVKDEFSKEENVPASKYNQLLRKQREADLEKKELEKQLEEAKTTKVDEKETDEFFKEDKEETPDPSKIIEEKLKPIQDAIKRRDESDKKIQRTAFFEAHPQYLGAEKWQELLDEMENSISPNSKDDYYTQLEKTHRILSGESGNSNIENKKTEIATDASSSGDGAEKKSVREEFTAEDRKYQKEFNVSDEGMRAYKQKIESGAMRILS